MGRRGYPPEFRRRIRGRALVEAGRKVRDVARDLGVTEQSIYAWRKQDRIDRGLEPGVTSATRRGERTPPLACRSRPVKLGQPDPGGAGEGGKQPDNAGTVQHRQMVRVRQARREGVT
jgi:transposase